MINEMDLLRMDERQRAAWLLANRATVIVVGLTWIAMIVWELAHDRSPLFLVVMVPVFAMFRGLFYLYYLRLTPAGSLADAVSRSIRPLAAVFLIVSAFVPMYRLESGSTTAWQLIAEDWLASFPLAFVYLWPIAVLFVVRATKWKRMSLALQFAEPFLAAASTLVILWIPQMMWEFDTSLFPWLFIPISARPAAGVLLAVAANGLFIIGWLVLLLRPAEQEVRHQDPADS